MSEISEERTLTDDELASIENANRKSFYIGDAVPGGEEAMDCLLAEVRRSRSELRILRGERDSLLDVAEAAREFRLAQSATVIGLGWLTRVDKAQDALDVALAALFPESHPQ